MAAPAPVHVALLAVAGVAAVGVFACCGSTRSSSGSSALPASNNVHGTSSAGRRRRTSTTPPATGPPVRSFGSAKPDDHTTIAAPAPALQHTGSPVSVAAADTPAVTVYIAQDRVKLRSSAGRFSPVVSAPAGSKLPGYNRKPPAGGRRQAAPLAQGTPVSVVEKGADKGGAPWIRVETAERVVGWLAQSSVAPAAKPEQ